MKTLSFRQPWASLICAGIKDVENRTWNTKFRGRFLIHSSSYKCPKDVAVSLPLEMTNTLLNEDLYGNFDSEYYPSSAIIGYVDLVDCVEGDYDSIWADEGVVKFVLENAHWFDEPITDVKGKLHFFDYDLDENNLPPSHKAERRTPKIEDSEIFFPVNSETFDSILANKGEEDFIALEETVEVLDLFYDYDEKEQKCKEKNLDGVKTIRFVAKDGREETFKFNGIEADFRKDDNDKPILWPNLAGEDVKQWQIFINFE
ncbi:MAG: ASCH domain-containing protein [Bacteroidales bacterium]|nr:ASCH domain-containing protein [Bacteroidales bacterium]